MKKFKVFGLILLAGAIAFTSCKKDEPEGPTLSVTANKTSVWKSDTLTFSYTVSSNEELEKLSYTTSASNIVSAGEEALSGNSKTGTIEIIFPSTGLTDGDDITFSFKCLDKDGEEYAATQTVTIAFTEPAASGTTLAYEKTGGVIWNFIGPNQGAWDLVTNVGKSSGDAAADKDMINSSTVSAGWVNAWAAGNATLFVQANTFNYTSGTLEDAQTAYSGGTASGTVTNPAVNDIYIAKLRGGSDYAVIKITGVTVTPSDNLDKIEFSYKKVAQ